MKKTILTLVVSLLGSVFSQAAVYVFDNGSGADANGIVDLNGRAFRANTTVNQQFTGASLNGNWFSAGPGVVSVGIFSTDSLSNLNQTQLISSFTNTFASGTFAQGAGGQRGTFSLTPSNIIIQNSVFQNKNIYLFAGNGSTFENSTQFLVLKHSSQFLAADDNSPTPIDIIFQPGNTTLLLGTTVTNVPTTNSDASTNAGWAMVTPVPETSTTLLGALGALAMLRRRRR